MTKEHEKYMRLYKSWDYAWRTKGPHSGVTSRLLLRLRQYVEELGNGWEKICGFTEEGK